MRDHALSGLAGLLLGFLAAYFLFESVAEQQPQRLVHGGEAAAVPGQAPSPGRGAPGAGGSAAGARPRGQAPFLDRIDDLEAAIEASPGEPEAVRRLAQTYFDAGIWDRAGDALSRYLELAPDDPGAIADFGVTLYQRGDYEAALSEFRRAQELSPDHFQSAFNEALALYGLRRFDDASALVDRLRRQHPDRPELDQLAASIAEQRG